MQRITDWTPEQMALTKAALDQYKEFRALIRDARIVHLLPPRWNVQGQGWGWDAIQAVAPDQSRSVVMVYRAQGDTPQKVIRPRGLRTEGIYRVRLTDAGKTLELTGEAIAEQGIEIALPEFSAEIIQLSSLPVLADH